MDLDEKLAKRVETFIYWSLYLLVLGAVVSMWILYLRHDLFCLYQYGNYKRIIFDLFSIVGFSVLMTPIIRFFVVILFPFTYILKLNKPLLEMLK